MTAAEPRAGAVKTSPGRARLAALFARGPVRALVLVVAVALAFGAAVGGELVWDDAAVVGSAASLPSFAAAFATDLFALGGAQPGAGASYFRPLVTLSYYADVHLAPAAPELALHLSTLLWHALASVLAARALARWIGALGGPAVREDRAAVAGWLAALVWAVLPLKAENAAWISGRGDALGLAVLLAGLELRRLARGRWARVALALVATAAALLAKEAFVVACVIVAIDVAADGVPLRRAARSPEAIGSALVAAGYLALRGLVLGVHGGGEAMFAGLGLGDRVALVLETAGHAVRALALPTRPRLLRGPIGFTAPFVLDRDAAMAALGAAALVGLSWLALRVPRSRAPLALLAGTFLPVSNVVPTGLESRMSDRFLYVPSLGLALGLAGALAFSSPALFRRAALVAVVAAVALGVVSARRSALFRSGDALWSWERAHGDGAATVLVAAGSEAIKAHRYLEARDLRVEAARRYAELGFAPEAFPYALEAARLQVTATGEAHMPSYKAYARALASLVAGRGERVEVPLSDGPVIALDTGTDEARAYAAARRQELAMRLLVLQARAGADEATEAADALVAACERCTGTLLGAARVALALLRPARARELAAPVPRPNADAESVEAAAGFIERALGAERAGPPALGEAEALFAAEAYRRACRLGASALGDATRPAERALVGAACALGGAREEWARLRPSLGPLGAELERDLVSLRVDRRRREALLAEALHWSARP